jgi:uncharacterized protein YvpB
MTLQNNLRTHQITKKRKSECCSLHSTAAKSFDEDTYNKESCYKKGRNLFANDTQVKQTKLFIYMTTNESGL